MTTLKEVQKQYEELYNVKAPDEPKAWLMNKIDKAMLDGVDKVIHPTGLTHIYFDGKNEIIKKEVLKETSDGTFVCWDEEAEMPLPFPRSKFKIDGGVWGTEKEAAENAIERMKIYVTECEKEIEYFKTLI